MKQLFGAITGLLFFLFLPRTECEPGGCLTLSELASGLVTARAGGPACDSLPAREVAYAFSLQPEFEYHFEKLPASEARAPMSAEHALAIALAVRSGNAVTREIDRHAIEARRSAIEAAFPPEHAAAMRARIEARVRAKI